MTIQPSIVQPRREKFLLSDGLIVITVLIPFILHLTFLRGVAIYFVAAVAPIMLFFLFYKAEQLKDLISFFIFSVFILTNGFLIFIFKSDTSALVFSYSILSALVFSKVLLFRPKAALFSSRLILVMVYCWYFYSIFSIGSTPDDANNYLYNLSRNHVSFLLLVVCWFYYATRFFQSEKYSLIPILILFIASIQLYGRVGIALSVLSLALVFIHFLLIYKRYKTWVVFLIGSLFVFLVFLLIVFVFNEAIVQTGFAHGLESPRGSMVEEYLSYMQAVEFLVGRDLSFLPIISKYDGNPHNTFIRGHSIFGVFFILFIFYLILFSFYRLIFRFSIKRLLFFSIFVLFLIRAYYDTVFFISFFDFILMYLFYISVKSGPINA